MHFRIALYCILSAALVLCALPEAASAQDDSSVKAKKRGGRRGKNSKVAPAEESALDEDPYGDESGEANDEQDAEETAGEEASGEEEQPAAEVDEVGGTVQESLAEQGSLRRSGRVEFDERLVKGQAAKSGAVYLFKRVPRRLPGLVPMRRSYRRRIVEPVLGEREIKPQQIRSGEVDSSESTKAKVEPRLDSKKEISKEPPKSPKVNRKGRRGNKRKTKAAAGTEEK